MPEASALSLVQQSSQFRGVLVEKASETAKELDGSFVARGGCFFEEFTLDFADLGCCVRREGLTTPYAEWFVSRCLSLAAWAGLRSDRVGGIFLNVHSMDSSEFAVGIFGEDRDIATSNATPADPTVVIFNVRLTQPSRSEITCARLSEVRRCDWPCNVRTVCEAIEDILECSVRYSVWRFEFRPQRRLGVIAAWVDGQPFAEVRDRRDECRRTATRLPIESHFEPHCLVEHLFDRRSSIERLIRSIVVVMVSESSQPAPSAGWTPPPERVKAVDPHHHSLEPLFDVISLAVIQATAQPKPS